MRSMDINICFLQNNSKGATPWPNFMALLTAEFCAYDYNFPAVVQVPSFCATLVRVECLVTLSMHAKKTKFVANP